MTSTTHIGRIPFNAAGRDVLPSMTRILSPSDGVKAACAAGLQGAGGRRLRL